jgi:hypothetical protein
MAYGAYLWNRWKEQRLFDGPGGFNFIVQGVDADAGTDQDGGDLRLAGGDATGSGSSDVVIAVATRGASGVADRLSSEYMRLDGDSLSQDSSTIRGLIKAIKSALFQTTGDETSLTADASSGTGYPFKAKGDATSPARATINQSPLNSDPSTPANGDTYVNSVDDHISHYGPLNRFQHLDPLVKAMLTTSDSHDDTSGTEAVFQKTSVDIKYTIPAGTLRVGSVIRIKASGLLTRTAPTATINLRFRIGGVSGAEVLHQAAAFTYATNSLWSMVTEVTVRAIGASGSVFGHGRTQVYSSGSGNVYENVSAGTSPPQAIDTTGDLDVVATYDWSTTGNGNLVDMRTFTVEVE